MTTDHNRDYWDRKIIDWENSWQSKGQVSPVERIGSLFRGPLKARSEITIALLRDRKDLRVLELGCGSGFFALELLNQGIASEVVGIDFSRSAISRANALAATKGLSQVARFEEGDVVTMTAMPEADLTVGLGFLDYLTLPQMNSLFRRIRSSHYIFTFPERIRSLRRFLHVLYLRSQRCPGHYYFTEREMMSCASVAPGTPSIVRSPSLSFGAILHNLYPKQAN